MPGLEPMTPRHQFSALPTELCCLSYDTALISVYFNDYPCMIEIVQMMFVGFCGYLVVKWQQTQFVGFSGEKLCGT